MSLQEGDMRFISASIILLVISLVPVRIATSNGLIKAQVIGVSSGDSITVIEPGNIQVKLLLYGIDCPEKDQAFGKEATQFTSDQCIGKSIRYKLMGIDRYGRTIAVIYLDDDRELNLEIIKAGYAWHYKRYAARPDYADAEKKARKAGLGLWADPNPTPPWEWRQERRQKTKKP